MKTIKTIISGLFLISLLSLTACSSAIPPQDAPCDSFGQHCDPKIPINQWRPSQS